MTAAHNYRDLHELIDRLEPAQAEELRRHALRLGKDTSSRFRVLRPFEGPKLDLGAQAKEILGPADTYRPGVASRPHAT